MNNVFLALDPGAKGALVVFKDKILTDELYDFNEQVYKDIFTKYKGCKCYMEYIATVLNGAFGSFQLGKNIGFIKGLGYGLVDIIEKNNTPKEWKKPWGDYLIKPKGVTWPKDEAKKRDIQKCLELYPDADVYERDEKGEIKVTKHRDGTIEKKILDGRCDAILIGRSRIERGLVD